MKRGIESGTPRRRARRPIKAAVASGILVIGVTHAAAAMAATTRSDPPTAPTTTIAASSAPARLAPRVPGVVGKSKAKAVKALESRGYVVRTKTKSVSHGSSGRVLSQKPRARTPLAPGSRVTLTINKVSKPKSASTSNCTPGYSPCLPYASDYDCAGGSGNGPKYVYGTVRVTGSDPYDLDPDGDGYGCD